ncbi:MAG: AAA family ATPase [Oscillospiraceae bacterium]|nr:AAA family ATPase [Oscillospiraceae bacterium]
MSLDYITDRLLTAEQGVLGSMLIDEKTVGPMLMAVSEDDFQAQENRNIFRAFRELYNQGRAPDPLLVNEHLGRAYDQYLAKLVNLTPTAANAEEYAKSLRETSRLYRLRQIGGQLAQANDPDECRELIDRANMLLCERSGVQKLTMEQGFREFFARHDKKNRPEPVRFGFSKLDEVLRIGGGDMVVIGGYPSAGKTAFALQLASHIARERRVGFFSYETSADKLYDRMVACQTLTSYRKIMSDKLEKPDFEQVYEAGEHLKKPDLEYLETSGMTVSGIGSYAMANHYDVIVVDYLQKLPASGQVRNLSDVERVSQVSSDLQQLGRRTGKTIIALSQLNRQETKVDKKTGEIVYLPPTLSSLRQSGQIEQDADVVLLLYKENPEKMHSRRCLDVAKNKDGLAGVGVLLDFDGDNQRFRQSTAQPVPEPKPKAQQQSLFRELPYEPSPFDNV